MRKVVAVAVVLVVGFFVVSNSQVRQWADDLLAQPSPSPTVPHSEEDPPEPEPEPSAPPQEKSAVPDDEVRYSGQAWTTEAPSQGGGSDYPKRLVDCDGIDAVITLGTNDERDHNAWKWEASASRTANSDGPPVNSVRIDPPTGTVEVGQHPTLHVTGSYEGQTFYVNVTSIYGSGSAGIDYTCR